MTDLAPGIVASLVTPFTAVDEVDGERLRAIVRFALAAGVDGLMCTALAGEGNMLTGRELCTVVGVVLDEAAGRVPLVVGVSGRSLADGIEAIRFAEREGAAALLVGARPYADCSDSPEDQVVRLAHESRVPVMLQEAPGYVGRAFGVAAIERILTRAETVRHLKIEGGPSAVRRAMVSLGDRVGVWGGDGGMYLLDCLRAGAAGVMPGVEIIDLLVRAYRTERSGDRPRADALMARVLPVIVLLMQSLADYVAGAKAILAARGLLAERRARLEGAAFDPVQRRILADQFAALADLLASA
jgi:dihydrodipicolinate synthase/N-acetylneuraminate lyase